MDVIATPAEGRLAMTKKEVVRNDKRTTTVCNNKEGKAGVSERVKDTGDGSPYHL